MIIGVAQILAQGHNLNKLGRGLLDDPRYGFRQEDFSCFTLYKSKKDVKDQETIQSSTTPDPGYRKGK